MAAVELDVQLTRDGRLAVIHDETLDRTTNGHGPVQDFTLAELQRLDAGQGEPIPALEEVLELVRGRAQLLVEMKQPDAAAALLEFFRQHLAFDAARVISFWHPALKALKEAEPRLQDRRPPGGLPGGPGRPGPGGPDRYPGPELSLRQPGPGGRRPPARDQGHRLEYRRSGNPAPYLDLNLDAICTNRPREIIDYLARTFRAFGSRAVAAGPDQNLRRLRLESLCHRKKSVGRASLPASSNQKLWKPPCKP